MHGCVASYLYVACVSPQLALVSLSLIPFYLQWSIDGRNGLLRFKELAQRINSQHILCTNVFL